jgi:hypothetical protein
MSTETKSNPKTNISSEMQGAIGREISRKVSFPISESDIRKWAMAIYYPEEPPRLYWDPKYAASTEHGGIVAPEEFNPFAWMSAEPNGVQKGGTIDGDYLETALGIKGPGLKFMLNGGMEADFVTRMRPGDVITSVGRLHGYKEREGRLGLMLFSTTEDTWTNQKGDVVKKQRMTLIRY